MAKQRLESERGNPAIALKEEKQRLRRLSLMAMLFALTILLAWLESLLPPPPVPVPVRYGLANIPVLYALIFCGPASAYLLACFKAFFALLTRGGMAALLSLCGGLLSVSVMALLYRFSRGKASLIFLSALAAVAHNLAQFFVVIVLYQAIAKAGFFVLLPPLLLFGLAAGLLTGFSLKILLPAVAAISGVTTKGKD